MFIFNLLEVAGAASRAQAHVIDHAVSEVLPAKPTVTNGRLFGRKLWAAMLQEYEQTMNRLLDEQAAGEDDMEIDVTDHGVYMTVRLLAELTLCHATTGSDTRVQLLCPAAAYQQEWVTAPNELLAHQYLLEATRVALRHRKEWLQGILTAYRQDVRDAKVKSMATTNIDSMLETTLTQDGIAWQIAQRGDRSTTVTMPLLRGMRLVVAVPHSDFIRCINDVRPQMPGLMRASELLQFSVSGVTPRQGWDTNHVDQLLGLPHRMVRSHDGLLRRVYVKLPHNLSLLVRAGTSHAIDADALQAVLTILTGTARHFRFRIHTPPRKRKKP